MALESRRAIAAPAASPWRGQTDHRALSIAFPLVSLLPHMAYAPHDHTPFTPQATQGAQIRATAHRHRQAHERRCGEARDPLRGGTSPASLSEQPCENPRQPTRQRERWMPRFKSPRYAQRFLSAHGLIARHFRPRCHRISASAYRHAVRPRFQRWYEVTGTAAASGFDTHERMSLPAR
jgi:hypothetical protein